MRLSSLADYAIRLMAEAACACGGVHLNATRLAERTSVPLPTTQKLVRMLVHAELLRSERGAAGGIKLARPAAAITMADIIEAIEGPIALTACVGGEVGACIVEEHCHMGGHLARVNSAVRGALADVTLASLSATQRLGQHSKMELQA